MNTYYKYTKYFGLDSIANCYLRLSTPATLNDPFEAEINEIVESNITSALEKDPIFHNGFRQGMNPELIKKVISNSITNTINDFGIVALSETPRNLLMWAHYANEHQGICIGFKKDMFNKKHDAVDPIIESYIPLKVNYDNIRPQVIENIVNARDVKRHHIRQQLLTKSNDWIYEKEHRCIIPIRHADRIKLLNDHPKHSFIRDFIEHEELQEVEDSVFEGSAIGDLIPLFYDNKNALFLKSVDISKIESVYIGCKFPLQQKKELIDAFRKEDSKFNHIKLYECHVSKTHFELELNILNPLKNN